MFEKSNLLQEQTKKNNVCWLQSKSFYDNPPIGVIDQVIWKFKKIEIKNLIVPKHKIFSIRDSLKLIIKEEHK